MKKINSNDFLVKAGKKVDLADWPTKMKALCDGDDEYDERLARHVKQMSKLQELLYASDTYSMLLIFQAMDAAGKDSAIKHVMSGVNPQGCQVFSFKHPSAEELDHDFLWRTSKDLPERGRIGIFNRSYYEEVLIVRVHPKLLKAQNLPKNVGEDKDIWEDRFLSIRNFEQHLHKSGTKILKFFLHLSKEEQRTRFLKRLENPKKHWKFQAGDLEERKYWRDYQAAYEQCLSATSSKHAPWFVVPADNKKDTRLIISHIIREALGELKMSYPTLDKAGKRQLAEFRAALSKKK